jgi:hypothetical protein
MDKSLVLHWREFEETNLKYVCQGKRSVIGIKSPSTRRRDQQRLQNFRTAKGFIPQVSDSTTAVPNVMPQ